MCDGVRVVEAGRGSAIALKQGTTTCSLLAGICIDHEDGYRNVDDSRERKLEDDVSILSYQYPNIVEATCIIGTKVEAIKNRLVIF